MRDFGVEHHEHQLGLLDPKFHTRAKPNPPVVGVFLTPQGNSGPRELLYFLSPGVSVLFWPSLAFSGPPHCLGSTPAYIFFFLGGGGILKQTVGS